VSNFQLVLRTVLVIFLTCATLAVIVAGVDAFVYLPQGDFLVRKFSDVLTLCVGALAGLLAGQHLSMDKPADREVKRRKTRQSPTS
jgi:uncharacterized membrane protein YfcA